MVDDRIECLICGRRLLSLGPHLAHAHRISGADYLAEHQLPAGTPLIAESLRRLLAGRRAATDADPVKADRARLARTLAGQRSAPAAHQALRAASLAKVRAAGFNSIADAVADTRSLTIQRCRSATGRQRANGAAVASRSRRPRDWLIPHRITVASSNTPPIEATVHSVGETQT